MSTVDIDASAISTRGPIMWFDELDAGCVELAGGKGANLGELVRAGFPVPPGFVVTAPAYLHAMESAGVRDRLREVERHASSYPGDAPAELQALVRKAGLPAELRAAAADAYAALGQDLCVAVRSSATAEDTAAASFAGMNETFTNVRGID
ncbi:MAG TPA: PEP/pyruvate-binding domain-containing protein, partial [Acidimicrobiia bacterium]|nr:PEP/pyruvate-binding domain-containing protein [Acidimicrobiia bacterium]